MDRAHAYPHADLTQAIIGAFYDVYNGLGTGFREIVYERALGIELTARGIRWESQVPATVWYKDQVVGTFRADIIVARTVLIELKAVPGLESAHTKQLLNELKAARIELGLLLNFGPRPQIRRFINRPDPVPNPHRRLGKRRESQITQTGR